MPNVKRLLRLLAHACRLISRAIQYWYVLVALFCLFSPISPHLRVPYQLSYSDCAYIGTRGLQSPGTNMINCPWITVINTRNGEIVSW